MKLFLIISLSLCLFVGLQGGQGHSGGHKHPKPSPSPSVTPTPLPSPTATPIEVMGEWYVSSSGNSGNTGAIGSPWDLASAFSGHSGSIQPGDTVYLRAGTYLNTTGWSITVAGNASQPVKFRNYGTERATLDTGSGSIYPVLTLSSDYVWVIGLEITNSNTSPDTLDSGDGVSHSTAAGCKVINCIIHDNTGNGIGGFVTLTSFEGYGNLLYFNGKTPNAGPNYAYGIYTQGNTNGTGKDYRANAVWGNWGNYPIHCYTGTAGQLTNLRFYNNVTLKANSSGASGYNLIGGGATVTGHVWNANYSYGYVADSECIYDIGGQIYNGATNASVTDNYYGRGVVAMSANNSGTVYTGNTQFGGKIGFTDSTCSTCGGYSGNTNFATTPGANWGPFVIPNTYESGRALVVSYNWTSANSVDVDFSSFLNAGDSYEIRDIQNFYGSLIGSGTYAGGTVSISTTGTGVATPTTVPSGRSTPTHTSKEFQSWIIIRTAQGESASPLTGQYRATVL